MKNLGGDDAVKNIARAFEDPSALLKHECAYCLGQMQNETAIPILMNILDNLNEDPMVRHEAGEALGAIGKYNENVLEILKKYSNDKYEVVSETCQIALKLLEWHKSKDTLKENLSENPYYSVDPAPPSDFKLLKVEDLKVKLLDENENLFERYRAMFALRNIGTDESILALCEGNSLSLSKIQFI